MRLDWDVLPPGEEIWKKVREYIVDSSKPPKRKRGVILRRIDTLESIGCEIIATRNAEFGGYVVLKHIDTGLFIFENPNFDNATYIFNDNWVELSQMTKGQIIHSDLHVARIIHSADWHKNIKEFFINYKSKLKKSS